MPNAGKNTITGIIGAKGSGKSTEAEKMFLARDRAIVCDALGEYRRGFMVSNKLLFVAHVDKQKKFRIVFLPLELEDFDVCCRTVRAAGNVLFVIEEAGTYCSPSQIPDAFQKLVRLGRHRNIDITYTAQRFQDINRTLTAQTDVFKLFRVSEPVDLAALQKRFGDDLADEVSRQVNYEFRTIVVSEWGIKSNVDSDLDSSVGSRGMVHRELAAASRSDGSPPGGTELAG